VAEDFLNILIYRSEITENQGLRALRIWGKEWLFGDAKNWCDFFSGRFYLSRWELSAGNYCFCGIIEGKAKQEKVHFSDEKWTFNIEINGEELFVNDFLTILVVGVFYQIEYGRQSSKYF
jgi:hypothetical protein